MGSRVCGSNAALVRLLLFVLLSASLLFSTVAASAVSGLSFELDTSVANSQESRSHSSTQCAGPFVERTGTYVVSCPTSRWAQGRINGITSALWGFSTAFNSYCPVSSLNQANPNCGCSACSCFADPVATRAAINTTCFDTFSCSVSPVPGTYPTNSDPCPSLSCFLGTSTYDPKANLAFDYTCGNYLRSTFFHVFTTASETAAPGSYRSYWWTSGMGVYLSNVTGSGTALDGLSRRLIFPSFQQYANFWIFNNNGIVTLASLGLASGMLRSSESSMTGATYFGAPTAADVAITASIHVPTSSSQWGLIWVAYERTRILSFSSTDGNTWSQRGSYSYTNCSNVRCYRAVPGSVRCVVMESTSNKYVFFGTSAGRIIRFDAEDNSQTPAARESVAGAGVVYSMAHAAREGRDYLYLGTSVNLLVEWDIVGERIASLAFLPLASTNLFAIETIVVDRTRKVLFFGAGDGATALAGRINLNGPGGALSIFDTESLPALSISGRAFNYASLHSAVLDVTNNAVIFGSGQPISSEAQWTQGPRLVRFKLSSCSHYTCSACGVDDHAYCGYCAGTDSCVQISAINATSCPAENLPFSQPARCPTVTGISKSEISSSGGSQITLYGSNFFPAVNLNRYSCSFGGQSGVVSSVTATSVTCETTPMTPNAATTATLSFGGRGLDSAQAISIVDCASLSCDSCLARPDCSWCYRAGGCRAANVAGCTGPSTNTTCPTLKSMTPGTAAVRNSVAVTIEADDLLATEKYKCSFGSYETDAVFSATPTRRVTCPSPAGQLVMGGLAPVSLLISTDPTNEAAPFVQYSQLSSVSPFDLYDCDAIPACFPCISGHPECAYCRVSTNTAGGCSYNVSNTVDCSSGATGTGTCPQVSSLSPSLLHYVVDVGATVTATLTSPGIGATPNTADLRCVWSAPNGTQYAAILPAQAPISVTSVVCPGPPGSSPLALGSWKLEIWNLGTPYTNGLSLRVYDCSAGASKCSVCEDANLRPACRWCNSLLTCEAPGALPGGVCPDSSSPGCPTITISPAVTTKAGGDVVAVTPNPFPAGQTIASCRFSGLGLNTEVTATYDAVQAKYFCSTPPALAGGSATVMLVVNSIEYAPSIPISYIDCTQIADGTRLRARNCSDCLTLPGCGWCGSSCESSISCQVGGLLSQCPVVTSVSPNVSDAANPKVITVTTNPAPPAVYSYDCLFGSTAVPAVLNGNNFECVAPRQDSGGVFDVKVAIRGASLFTTEATPPKITLFRCPDSISSCGSQCFATDHCGFCLESGRCTGSDACKTANATTGIWLSKDDGCPSLVSVGPSFMQAAFADRALIREQVAVKVTNLKVLPTVAAKRAAANLADFACVFGGEAPVPVDRFDEQTSTFYCTAPVLYDQGFYGVFLTYKGNRLLTNEQQQTGSGNPNRFQILDCFSIKNCELCLLQPQCGWCRGSVQCMTKAWCDAEPFSDWNQTCPALSSVSPATGLITGGYEITITGGPFVNSSDFNVAVNFTAGSRTLNATFVSQNRLSIQIPAAGSQGWESIPASEVKLQVFLGNTRYTPSTLTFTFIEQPSIVVTNTGVSGGAIGGIVAALAVVIGVLIAALVIMKRRKVGFFAEFRLKEPDYNVVAFGAMMQQQWRIPKDSYDLLALKLLAKDHIFILNFMQAVPPTEQEVIARSLTHFLEFNSKSVEYGSLFIVDEVGRNQFENTIFRNNSMASKWFKFYSKIVGVKYLFNTLARFIYELNKISELSAKAKTKRNTTIGSGQSLLSIEMEVDPDRFGESALTDSEANVYQLILTCQKVFHCIRQSVKDIPKEFKIIFQSINSSVMEKFNSKDAILKAVGGFFFLRFIGPAITAPHAYGLLENPPNETAQRQLVLIGKVMQNLANMTMPGVKETFMQQLNDFFTRNIPRMVEFYDEVLSSRVQDLPETSIVQVSEITRDNALGFLWDFMCTHESNLRKSFDAAEKNGDSYKVFLMETFNELREMYPKRPRKYTPKDTGGDDEKKSKKVKYARGV